MSECYLELCLKWGKKNSSPIWSELIESGCVSNLYKLKWKLSLLLLLYANKGHQGKTQNEKD